MESHSQKNPRNAWPCNAAILKAFSSSSAALTPAMLLLVASAALSAYTFYLIGTLVLLEAYENHWFPLRRSKIKPLFPRGYVRGVG